MIYYLRCDVTGLVKIGCSTDERTLCKRVRSHRSSSPTWLEAIAVVEGECRDEAEAHQRHMAHYSHGEFFALPIELIPEDAMGLAPMLNNLGTPRRSFAKHRPCKRCGKDFAIPVMKRTVGADGVSKRIKRRIRKWCNACAGAAGKLGPTSAKDDSCVLPGHLATSNSASDHLRVRPATRVDDIAAAAVAHRIPKPLLKKWADSGLSVEAAVAAAIADEEFMSAWKACRAAGITLRTMSRRVASGMTLEKCLAMGPGRSGVSTRNELSREAAE